MNWSRWDHPRSRGNHAGVIPCLDAMTGSPPLAREPQLLQNGADLMTGITPARAGTTTVETKKVNPSKDHPRSRGNHGASGRPERRWRGSPPLAREPLYPAEQIAQADGITPARAGTTAKDPLKMPAFCQPLTLFYSLSHKFN